VPRGGCKKGWHKICVYISADDFHWYRQDSDGYWSDKPGTTCPTNYYPGTHDPITDPTKDARLRGYRTKCGCLCAKDKPWGGP